MSVSFFGDDRSDSSGKIYLSGYDGVKFRQIEEREPSVHIGFCDYIRDVMYYAANGGELRARYLAADEVKDIRITQTSVLGLGAANDRLICLTYSYSLGNSKSELCILNEVEELSAFAALEGNRNSRRYVAEEGVACLLGQNKVFTYTFGEDFFDKH